MISKSWEQRKTRERSRNTSVLDGIPAALPSLLSAYRITEKASGIGFDWPEYAPVREKLNEELQEFDDAYATQDAAAIDHEFGDLLFTLVNMSRFLPVTPESSLRRAVRRFETRFKHVEQAVAASGRDMHNVPMTELERFWSRAKEAECS